jgi:hypothetical protein
MNPRKLGGLANHRQEPWKVPLPQYKERKRQLRENSHPENAAQPPALPDTNEVTADDIPF